MYPMSIFDPNNSSTNPDLLRSTSKDRRRVYRRVVITVSGIAALLETEHGWYECEW